MPSTAPQLVEIETGRGELAEARCGGRREAHARRRPGRSSRRRSSDDGWRGHADFLERVERPSDLGAVELRGRRHQARALGQAVLLVQLCLYSELLPALQGTAPSRCTSCSARGERKTLRAGRLRRLLPPHAALSSRPSSSDGLERHLPGPGRRTAGCAAGRTSATSADGRTTTSAWSRACAAADRASSRRAGITTVAELAELGADGRPPRDRRGSLRAPAPAGAAPGRPARDRRAELRAARAGRADEARRGFARLPEPSEGDVFFDIEGDPFFEDGLEYLWGVT